MAQFNEEGRGGTDTVSDQIKEYIECSDAVALTKVFAPLSLSDALRELMQLPAEKRDEALSLLPAEQAAKFVQEAPNELAADLVERLDADTAATIIEELGTDIQADVIGELQEHNANAILDEMDATDAATVRRLAAYDGDQAGGLMQGDVFTFRKTDTVGDALKRLALADEDFERYRGQHPYVTDSRRHPVGVISLRTLLTAKRSALLADIMSTIEVVDVEAPLDTLRDIFDKNPYLGLPVVDAKGRLAGVVSRSAVDEAVLARTEHEGLLRHGVVGDELRTMPIAVRSRRRLAWLSVNIGLNIIAASIIASYEETLAAVIAIAIFLPMVSDMSGCSGNQAVAVTMRELSLGLIKPVDAFKVWYKEISIGVINGLVLGVLIGLVAWFWKGNPVLGMVIGLALAINTVIAVSIGGVVPLVLKRVGQDPAVASGPLLTTITDMAGFFLVLSLATLFMPYLV